MPIKPILYFSMYSAILFSLDAYPASKIENNANISEAKNTETLLLHVYKKPSCGCCKKWIEHLSADNTGDHEFKVYAHNNSKLEQLKANKGIAPRYQSCHTALSIEGYVFEGHIPAKIIKQFLANKPSDAIGLSVPGMPAGSPGMEMGNRFSPYDVLLLRKDGSSEIYAHITLQKEQY